MFENRFFLYCTLVLFLFWQRNTTAQPSYNNCNSALELCPGQDFSITNIGANKTFCPGCEDDFSFCFTANNTIWLTFTTNSSGGDVSIDFSNLQFAIAANQGTSLQATILMASVPCNAASYTAVGNCVPNGSAPFTLNATGLPPNTLYYVLISGNNSGIGVTLPAECTFDLTISGSAVDRPTPVLVAGPNNTTFCAGDILYVQANLSNCPNAGMYQWYINDTLVAQTSDTIFSTSDISDGDEISVTNTCYTLCPEVVTSGSFFISVEDFYLYAGEDLIAFTGQPVQLQGSTTASNFQWSPTYNVGDTLSLTTFVYPTQTTTYTLTATQDDCQKQDQVTVTVTDELLFPTTFSPNGDDINDTWEIVGAESFPNCFVEIFNRWGQQVFQATGYSKEKAWDGTIGSGIASEGVYFYIVRLRDEEKREYKGSIHLIR